MTDPERRIDASWRRNAEAWTSAVRAGALETRRLVTDQAIVNAVLALPARRVLDVGCGEGWLARRLAEAGRDVVGFDGNPDLIARAQAEGRARFVELDYDAFAREPQRVGTGFHAAVCNFSLLAERMAPLLRALAEVLDPAGRLVIQTVHPVAIVGREPYEDGWREERYEVLPGTWQPMPWYFRTLGSWIRELRAADWHIENIDEPLHPATGSPASLIITAVSAASPA